VAYLGYAARGWVGRSTFKFLWLADRGVSFSYWVTYEMRVDCLAKGTGRTAVFSLNRKQLGIGVLPAWKPLLLHQDFMS
jgi:hypothetical protein